MSVGVYVDHNVRGDIVHGLSNGSTDCLTCREDGTREWDDEELLQRATDLGRILFTMDEDFLRITAQWQASGRRFAGVIFASQTDITVGEAVRDVAFIASASDPGDADNVLFRVPW